jgi:tetratricopeptide (TPR) repeat protein
MVEEKVNHVADACFIVWLDLNVDTNRDDKDTKALIRRIVRGRLLTFTNPDQCVNHVFAKLKTQRITFIVSNLFGPHVVPLIHDVPQIQTIYVYCRDRQVAESWTKSYPKVSSIFTKKETLLRQICDDIGACSNDDDMPISVFHLEERQNSLQNLSEESAKFMWYQSILMVLRLMAKYYNSKTEMIVECRANYHNDEIEKKKINDFELNYAPTKAFWWYTSDSFVYRLLNKALRTQNIEIIFKFRFFINDLHNQIQQLYQQYLSTHSSHKKNHLIVYRGQRMTVCELNLLKNNVKQLISMNSFLSATTIREIAEIFADTSDQCNEPSPLQSVLFTIDIRDFNKDTTAFAFIQNYSCCQDEEEVLFTIGAIFKVESVIEDREKKIWHVHLQLNKQQNHQYKDLYSYMIKQIGTDPSPSTFGWFLYRMSEFNKAERYLQLLLKELPSDDIEVANAYNLLGLIYKDLKRLSESIKAYETALNIYSHSNSYNSSQVIAIHCNLGLAYLALHDYRSADEHQRQAEENLPRSLLQNDPLLVAMTVTLKAKIQIAHGDYIHAYENIKIALQKKSKKLPSDHPSIASTLNDMGIVQEKMNNTTKALTCFNRALEIRRKSLPSNHLDVAECLINIGRIHDKCKQHALASRQFELASKIAMNDIRE